jgi:dolichyl-phosphate beta-glucosyltransferase
MHLSLIIPAYNEARRIGPTLSAALSYLTGRGFDFEVIVAADGEDGTRERAAEAAAGDPRVRVIGHPERMGKGRGVREAMAMTGGRIVGFIDADDKTPIEELDKIWPWLEQGVDVVIGSRAMPDSHIEVPQKLYRWLGSRVFGLFMHLTVGLWHVRDTQCGFKFFRGDVGRRLFTQQRLDGYMFDIEVLFLAARFAYRVQEVGVRWRDDHDSRLDLVSGNWRNLQDVLRIRFGRYPAEAPSATPRARPSAG